MSPSSGGVCCSDDCPIVERFRRWAHLGAPWRGHRRCRPNVHVSTPFQCAAETVWPASSPRLLSGLKVAPASPRPGPAMRLPAIHEMDHNAEKRQADYPIPKKPRSENQHRACQENDPLGHSEEVRLSSLRKRDSQLSLHCILHLLNRFRSPRSEDSITTRQGFGDSSCSRREVALRFSVGHRRYKLKSSAVGVRVNGKSSAALLPVICGWRTRHDVGKKAFALASQSFETDLSPCAFHSPSAGAFTR
jgi:hypothetical protein